MPEVPYEELQGSPVERYAADGFAATRQLLTAWTNRAELSAWLLGGTTGTGTNAATTLPQAYPHFPGSARVTAVDIIPFSERVLTHGGATNTAAYTHAQLTVAYGTQGSVAGAGGEGENNLVTETIEPFAEFIQLPATGFKWGGTNGTALAEDEAPGKLYKGVNWVYERGELTIIPAAVFNLIGKVNSASVASYSLGQTFDEETLLYNPPLLTRSYTTDGQRKWKLELRFSYKPQGWNRFWRQDTQTWDRIYNASGPADPYETGDFTSLIL